MIKHVVVADAAPGATSAELDALIAGWRALPSMIEEIENLSAGRNLGLLNDRNTVSAVAEFADADAWKRFMTHPSHLAFRDELGSKFLDGGSLSIIQFEC